MIFAVLSVCLLACEAFVQLPDVGLKFARESDPSQMTPLDTYVWQYDKNAGFDVHPKTYVGKGFTAYVLDFKSQASKTNTLVFW